MRSVALTFALLVVLSGLVPAATVSVPAAAADAPPAGAVGPPAAAVDSDPRPQTDGTPLASTSGTDIRIRLRQSGDADWTIEMRYLLTSDNETAAFESFGEDYEAGEATVGFDSRLFRTVAERAAQSSGREMDIRNVSRTATVENETGVVTLSFTWTNFLETADDGSLRLGDAFVTAENETWFSSLETGQRLVVETPSGYVVNSTDFPIERQNVVITGPREFEQGDLVITYRQTGPTENLPWELLVGGGVAVVAVVAIAGALYFSRRGRPAPLANGGDKAKAGDGDAPQPTPAPDETVTSAPETPTAEPSAEQSEPSVTESTEPDVDVDLLSDEERIEYLLEQAGGRMKQANIVKETGWSDAKVSQLLSAMADDGRVDKLRLGRENLISLPDEGDIDE